MDDPFLVLQPASFVCMCVFSLSDDRPTDQLTHPPIHNAYARTGVGVRELEAGLFVGRALLRQGRRALQGGGRAGPGPRHVPQVRRLQCVCVCFGFWRGGMVWGDCGRRWVTHCPPRLYRSYVYSLRCAWPSVHPPTHPTPPRMKLIGEDGDVRGGGHGLQERRHGGQGVGRGGGGGRVSKHRDARVMMDLT